MKYWEGDFYDGPLMSCYMVPRYHPGCLGCSDRCECYGEEHYLQFREKALLMSKLLDQPDCLAPDNAARLAESLGISWEADQIHKILTGKACPDGKISAVMKLAFQPVTKY